MWNTERWPSVSIHLVRAQRYFFRHHRDTLKLTQVSNSFSSQQVLFLNLIHMLHERTVACSTIGHFSMQCSLVLFL